MIDDRDHQEAAAPLFRESELEFEYFRASGPGGQHRNTTDSAVRVRHLPTGIVVQATENRSQVRNRAMALERLAEALARRLRTKKRRLATNVPKGERKKRLEAKRRLADKKRSRAVPPE
jgi:ribosome-associated protein